MADLSGTLNPEMFRFSGGSGSYPNPMYRYIHTFIPTNLLELFQWCEFIYNNSPQLATSIRRFSEYPITDIIFPIENVHVKKYKQYYHDMDLKELLISCGIDFHIYGNAFISPYYPFIRHLICKTCKTKYNINYVKFSLESNFTWKLDCPQCGKTSMAQVRDSKVRDPKSFKWVRWSPKDIEIEYNEISGVSRYHLRVPRMVEQGIKTNNAHILKTTPLEIIDAVRKNKRFCFNPNAIYHMKAHTPSGFGRAWGFPILTQALYEVLHIAVLKRANEAIAWEHIVPKIIVSPAPSGTTGDPLKHVNMMRWRGEIEKAKEKWNKDPNFLMFTPFPVNVQQLGGNGRSLLVSAEIEAAEKNLAMALGIPLEFAAGTLAWQTSAMSLRLLKNQMHVLVGKMERLIQWMTDRTSEFLKWPTFKVSLAPFELADDEVRKQYLVTYNTQEKVSNETTFTAFGLDYQEELEKIKKEKVEQARWAREVEADIKKDSQSITERSKRDDASQADTDPSQNVTYVLQQGQQMAQLMISMGLAERKQALEQLRLENFALYAIVKELYNSMSTQMEGQAQAQYMEQAMSQAQESQGTTPTPSPEEAQQTGKNVSPQNLG